MKWSRKGWQMYGIAGHYSGEKGQCPIIQESGQNGNRVLVERLRRFEYSVFFQEFI